MRLTHVVFLGSFLILMPRAWAEDILDRPVSHWVRQLQEGDADARRAAAVMLAWRGAGPRRRSPH